MRERDLVVGLPSTAEALKNKSRTHYQIYATKEALAELQKRTHVDASKYDVEIKIMRPHEVQEQAKKLYQEFGFTYFRVPSNLFLLTSPLPEHDPTWLFNRIAPELKILALDQVSDAHNGAAILRTAAFYGVDAVLVSTKGSFGVGPNFHRMASGASEHLPIVKCGSLPKIISKLQSLDVDCLGLSEHETGAPEKITGSKGLCLVLGAEDLGLSYAVKRVLKSTVALEPQGNISSLNVSVAAAVAMDRYFRS